MLKIYVSTDLNEKSYTEGNLKQTSYGDAFLIWTRQKQDLKEQYPIINCNIYMCVFSSPHERVMAACLKKLYNAKQFLAQFSYVRTFTIVESLNVTLGLSI